MPVSVFYEQLVKSGKINKNQISYSTINRLLKNTSFQEKIIKVFILKRRKRFAYDKVNILWQADLSHDPYISLDGKMKKTFLIDLL